MDWRDGSKLATRLLMLAFLHILAGDFGLLTLSSIRTMAGLLEVVEFSDTLQKFKVYGVVFLVINIELVV